MAKKRKPTGIRAYLLAVRDKQRFSEGGDERYYAIKALEALESGDVEGAMYAALEIGRVQGRLAAMAEAEAHYGLQIDEGLKLWYRGYKALKAMREARQQADIPEADKREAVAMFKKLCAKYKAADFAKPATKAKSEIAKEYGVDIRTISRWRKSLDTL